jgi:hypothetical protein
MDILKVSPEHQKAVQPAVDIIKQQVMEIEQLREALVHVHTELSGIVDGLDDEELMVIKALQDVIYDVLDMVDDAAEAAAVPDVGPAVAVAAPLPAAPAPLPAAPAAQRGTRRESEGAAALQGTKEVAALEAKMAAASAKLQSLPLGKHVGANTTTNASRAMEQLLFRLGGFETIGRVVESFCARPAVRVAMTDHLKSQTASTDDKTVDEVITTAKRFFTGVMHTKGRRSDIDTNAFWAAAAALVPVTAREDKKVRSVMRVLGLRYESVKRAIEIRKAMVDSAAGWKWIKTAPH